MFASGIQCEMPYTHSGYPTFCFTKGLLNIFSYSAEHSLTLVLRGTHHSSLSANSSLPGPHQPTPA